MLRLGTVALVFTAISAVLVPAAPSLRAHPRRQSGGDTGEEVVANLAAGRAVVLVAKDGIVVGTTESRAEPETLPPLIVPLSGGRVAVLLGAVEWREPSSGKPSVRLDLEFRKAAALTSAPKSLQAHGPSDLEDVGLAFLEPLRAAAAKLHRKIALPENEPIVEILIVGYAPDYGPEVWSLRYPLVQEPMRGDFWHTRVLRPHFLQLYPPEKGQPRTLIEVRYPLPGAGSPALLELLKNGDPRLSRLRSSDDAQAGAIDRILRGESHRVPMAVAREFLLAALNGIAEQDARQLMVTIGEQKGLEWVRGEEFSAPVVEEKKREPGAPTLRGKRP
jgi:hypothetical protein